MTLRTDFEPRKQPNVLLDFRNCRSHSFRLLRFRKSVVEATQRRVARRWFSTIGNAETGTRYNVLAPTIGVMRLPFLNPLNRWCDWFL